MARLALVPPRRALRVALALGAVLAVLAAALGWIGGEAALVGFVLGVASGVQPAVSGARVSTRAYVGVLQVTGAVLGLAVSGSVVATALAVAAAALLQAPLNTRSASIAFFLPVVVAIAAGSVVEGSAVWLVVGVALGYLAVQAIASAARIPGSTGPVSRGRAWRHAVVLAVSVGLGTLETAELAHGYWLVLTLASVLRPVRGETTTAARDRAAGTLAGVVAAILVVAVLPAPVALALAVPCAWLMLGWALMRDTAKQTAFGTPVVVLVASAGAASASTDLALQRLALTAGGVALAVAAVWLLGRWDRAVGAVEPAP